jgi:hypothetical protein
MIAPSAISAGEPFSSQLATQFTSVMIAPTDKSSPPSSTGSVCAMPTMASAKASLAFCTSTAEEKPRGWLRL